MEAAAVSPGKVRQMQPKDYLPHFLTLGRTSKAELMQQALTLSFFKGKKRRKVPYYILAVFFKNYFHQKILSIGLRAMFYATDFPTMTTKKVQETEVALWKSSTSWLHYIDF